MSRGKKERWVQPERKKKKPGCLAKPDFRNWGRGHRLDRISRCLRIREAVRYHGDGEGRLGRTRQFAALITWRG